MSQFVISNDELRVGGIFRQATILRLTCLLNFPISSVICLQSSRVGPMISPIRLPTPPGHVLSGSVNLRITRDGAAGSARNLHFPWGSAAAASSAAARGAER